MRIRYLYVLLLLMSLFTFKAKNLSAQCSDKSGVFKCCDLFEDQQISYLSDYTVKNKKRKSLEDENGQKWELFLMKGTKYRLALCCYEGLDKIVMTLYDEKTTEETPLGTTFKDGNDYTYFDFVSNESKVYYLAIRYKDPKTIGEKLCAIGLLGFIGKVN